MGKHMDRRELRVFAERWVVFLVLLAGGDEPLPPGALARWTTPGQPPDPVLALAFAPDGKHAASGSKAGDVRLWQSDTGKALHSLKGHEGEVKAVAFSRDGNLLASAGADKVVRIWDAGTGKAIRVLEAHTQAVEALVFTPDGKLLVSAGQDEAIILWDVAAGRRTGRLDRHTRAVRGLAVSRDGTTLASGGEDRTICVWDLPALKERLSFKRPGLVHSVTLSCDGLMIASGGLDQTVHVRKVRQPGDILSFGGWDGPIHGVALSDDGKMVAAAGTDGKVRLWEMISGSVRREFAGHAGGVQALALSSDETRLLTGGADGQILVWDVTGAASVPAAPPQEWPNTWHALGGPADQAYEAMARLRADPDRLLVFLAAHLEPLFKLSERLVVLLRDLDSDRFVVRQKATAELQKLDDLAVPFLEEKLADKLQLETQRRIELLLMRARAKERSYSAFLQMWRTLEILESLATPPARAILQRIAKEMPDPRLRREAQAALERLERRCGRAGETQSRSTAP
jgi:hypothetical protein